MPTTPKRVKVYRKSTGEKLQRPMDPADLRWNPDLAVVPSHRDATPGYAPADDLDGMTVDALRNLATEQDIDVPTRARKADIIAALQSSPDPGEQAQPTHDDPAGSEHEKE